MEVIILHMVIKIQIFTDFSSKNKHLLLRILESVKAPTILHLCQLNQLNEAELIHSGAKMQVKVGYKE